ncbi:MAG: hypothetical protein AB1544_13840 [Pseudomonadota bacterium]|jgi:hypothetical protein
MAGDNVEQLIIDGEISPLRQKLREAAADLKKFGQEGGQAVSGMAGPLEMLRTKFVAIGAALTAGGMAVFIQRAIDAADNLGKLSQKIGVSVEDLAGFQHAANLSDLTLEQFSQGVKQLSKYMTEHGDKLRAAGITATDTKGALIQLADAFQQMRDGPQKTAIAMELLGKQGAELIPMLNGGGAALRGMIEEGQRFNPVTEEMAKRAEEFNDSMTRMQTRAGAVGVAIASDLLPHLNRFFDRLQQATESGFIDGFMSRWKAAFMGLAAAINEAMASVEEFLAKITFGSVAENHMKQAISLRESARRLYQEMAAMAPVQKQEASRSGKEDKPAKTNLASLLGGGKGASVEAKDPSFMQYYEAELALRKATFEQENTLRQFSKEQELAYWREVQQNLELTSKDRLAIAKRTATLELEIRRQSAKEQRDLDSVMVDSRRASALAQIQYEEQQANFARENGEMTKRELLVLEEQFARRRFEIEYQALIERLELAKSDPNASPAELARIKEQLLEIERNYQLRRGEIMQGKKKEEGGGGFFDGIGDSFGQAANAILTQATTLRQALGTIFQGIYQSFVANLISKPLGEWAAGLARMLAIKLGFLAEEKTADATAMVASRLAKKAEGFTGVQANAAVAATGAAASQASIPIVGPMLAMAAMAQTFAQVSAFGNGMLAVAAKGYDVPKGLNPLTQLHEEEMVLPKHLANAVRGMASGEAGDRGGGIHHHHEYKITAMDTRSFRDYLDRNSSALASGLHRVKRSYTPVGRWR